MGRSLKKGPFVDEKLFAKVMKQTDSGATRPDQDMGTPMHDSAGVCRFYIYGS